MIMKIMSNEAAIKAKTRMADDLLLEYQVPASYSNIIAIMFLSL